MLASTAQPPWKWFSKVKNKSREQTQTPSQLRLSLAQAAWWLHLGDLLAGGSEAQVRAGPSANASASGKVLGQRGECGTALVALWTDRPQGQKPDREARCVLDSPATGTERSWEARTQRCRGATVCKARVPFPALHAREGPSLVDRVTVPVVPSQLQGAAALHRKSDPAL